MSRLEWILGIMLVVLLGIVIVLSLMFWFRPDAPVVSRPANSATIIAERADDIAPTPVFEGQTAKVAFAAAQRTAVAWQADATLLSASATWPQGMNAKDLLTGETTWGFTFYSPDASKVALISVVENEANLVSEGTQNQGSQPLNVSGWNLDSKDAVQQMLDEGGAEFMNTEGVTTLTMMLSTDSENGRIEWLISLFATQNGRSLTMRLDATSGEILQFETM